MLTRPQRLVREEDFTRVYRRGRQARGGWLTLRVGPGLRGQTRFGIVVPNAVVARAVNRNRIRRQLRALIAHEFSTFPNGFDCIFQVHASPPRTMAEIKAEFMQVREKLNRHS
ncbi:ribonuclease P protein component [Candidatus Uhrbacteria bacterium RIFCSPHIGHO2_12_FULL_54_23]|uniref:Ribonuclease P protein component n=3 Tax=Candidatus Uhriibacteriota TaxID=1752732 RepID=A0A1F7UFG8_9BACT|nr:MAG: ribonuclease P protein component [Candidatus Uhrbacteria bacterium RIFCSPHIGHO2_12_FULL_54_23]OGL85280.1 MAG: ribonuclease P protein component [Candidatus Uhrbacteria bacterium RIFCSPLOWO2_01_FULL_55_36]OGL89533.1 MAG: ribonuclease P protein component [Candidatus Uhrbacteria bacterium RIFCSPLOWO2_02_FULL_54_37]